MMCCNSDAIKLSRLSLFHAHTSLKLIELDWNLPIAPEHCITNTCLRKPACNYRVLCHKYLFTETCLWLQGTVSQILVHGNLPVTTGYCITYTCSRTPACNYRVLVHGNTCSRKFTTRHNSDVIETHIIIIKQHNQITLPFIGGTRWKLIPKKSLSCTSPC